MSDFEPTWTAFLGQARWLLDQEQRRSANIQQNAVALLGFSGVVLGILVTNDFLADAKWSSMEGMVGRLAVALLSASALAAVFALVPRGTASVNIDDTIRRWDAFHGGETDYRATQHFGHMLLAKDAQYVKPVGRPTREDDPPPQVLRAAMGIADRRAGWTTLSAALLALGIVGLMLVVIWPHG